MSEDALPLSLLNDHLYCPRRAALKVVEGWREANVHTERGDIVHEHSDLPGYEVAKGVLLWRALPVFSERLGLNGKCDIVEVVPNAERGTRSAEPQVPATQPSATGPAERAGSGLGSTPSSAFRVPHSLLPVEFKLGKRRKWENDDAQLCAQALCLEEMFGVPVPRGAVFHADSKRRREVEFTAELRQLTERAVGELHRLLDSALRVPHSALPGAIFKPACEECSLFDICLPRATAADHRAERLTRQLFEV